MTHASLYLLCEHIPPRSSFSTDPTGSIFWGLGGGRNVLSTFLPAVASSFVCEQRKKSFSVKEEEGFCSPVFHEVIQQYD